MEPNQPKKAFKLGARIVDIDMQPYFYSNIRNSVALPKPKSKTILMVIDKSASMEGDNIDQSKKVLKLLFNFFRESLSDASLNLLTFDVKSVLTTDMHLMPMKEIDRIIDKIQADSSTFFSGVLKAIENFIRSKNFIDDLSIIFMTDGDIVVKQEKENNFKRLNDQVNFCFNTFNKEFSYQIYMC